MKNWGWFCGMLQLFAKCPRPVDSWENTLWKAICSNIQRPSDSVWCNGEYHPSSAKDKSRLHQFGKTIFTWSVCLDMQCNVCRSIWNGNILVAGIDELDILGASEIHARRINAKEIRTPKNGEHFILPIADGTVKLSGRDEGVRKSTSMRDQPVRSEEAQWRLSRDFGQVSTTRRNDGWQRSAIRFLVDRRDLHWPSSRQTSSSALSAEGRIFRSTTAIHWRDQENTFDFGCVARKPKRWLLEH